MASSDLGKAADSDHIPYTSADTATLPYIGDIFWGLLADVQITETPYYDKFQSAKRGSFPFSKPLRKFQRQFTGVRFPIGGSKK